MRATRVPALAAVASLALAGCGGSGGGAGGRAAATPTASPTASAAVSPAGPPTARPAAGGPVPAGFTPWSVTAVSESTFWVLGDAPCAAAPCTSLIRTTDSGVHFVGLPAPKAPLHQGSPATGGAAVSEVRFADPQDGWVFGPALWATHDGARTWQPVRIGGSVLSLAAAAGTVWAVTGDCTAQHGCTGYQLQSSPVGRDSFHPVKLPDKLSGPAPAPALALAGRSVYLLVNNRHAPAYRSTLLVSMNGGRGFAAHRAPCTVDLGGSLVTEGGAVWAVCPTGTMAAIYVSDAAGASFRAVPTPFAVPNSLRLAAAGPDLAVAALPNAPPQRTADGGRHWAAVRVPVPRAWSYAAFSDSRVGYLLQRGGDLLRTSDAGRSWARVHW